MNNFRPRSLWNQSNRSAPTNERRLAPLYVMNYDRTHQIVRRYRKVAANYVTFFHTHHFSYIKKYVSYIVSYICDEIDRCQGILPYIIDCSKQSHYLCMHITILSDISSLSQTMRSIRSSRCCGRARVRPLRSYMGNHRIIWAR